MKKVKTLAILNLFFFTIACLVSNLSQLKIIGNHDMGEISNKYDSVFAPAGVTFVIWGIIYLSLFGFTIQHVIRAFRDAVHTEASQVLLKIDYLFVANNIAITLWVFAFLNERLLTSVILIIIQFISLLMIHFRLNLYDRDKTLYHKLFTQFPLSIYFAWICVAMAANSSAYLVAIAWDGAGISESTWAIILLLLLSVITLFMVSFKRNAYFGLVVLWAIFGIQLKRKQVDAELFRPVINICWGCFGVLAAAVIHRFIKNGAYKRKETAP